MIKLFNPFTKIKQLEKRIDNLNESICELRAGKPSKGIGDKVKINGATLIITRVERKEGNSVFTYKATDIKTGAERNLFQLKSGTLTDLFGGAFAGALPVLNFFGTEANSPTGNINEAWKKIEVKTRKVPNKPTTKKKRKTNGKKRRKK